MNVCTICSERHPATFGFIVQIACERLARPKKAATRPAGSPLAPGSRAIEGLAQPFFHGLSRLLGKVGGVERLHGLDAIHQGVAFPFLLEAGAVRLIVEDRHGDAFDEADAEPVADLVRSLVASARNLLEGFRSWSCSRPLPAPCTGPSPRQRRLLSAMLACPPPAPPSRQYPSGAKSWQGRSPVPPFANVDFPTIFHDHGSSEPTLGPQRG